MNDLSVVVILWMFFSWASLRDVGHRRNSDNALWKFCFLKLYIMPFNALTVIEVESVEVHALHQVAKGLWLKWGQTRITDFTGQKQKKNFLNNVLIYPPKHWPKWKSYTHNSKQIFCDLRISFKVSIVNGLNKLFSDFNDLLFACCQRKQARNIRKHIFFLPLTHSHIHKATQWVLC